MVCTEMYQNCLYFCVFLELDYVPVNQNVAFQPGEEYKTIEVPIIDDTLLESNETFTIELVSDKAYVLANTSTSEVTIIENECECQFIIYV